MIEFVRGIVVHGTTASADNPTVPSVMIAILYMLRRAVLPSHSAFLFVSLVLLSSLTVIIEIACTEWKFCAFNIVLFFYVCYLANQFTILNELVFEKHKHKQSNDAKKML